MTAQRCHWSGHQRQRVRCVGQYPHLGRRCRSSVPGPRARFPRPAPYRTRVLPPHAAQCRRIPAPRARTLEPCAQATASEAATRSSDLVLLVASQQHIRRLRRVLKHVWMCNGHAFGTGRDHDDRPAGPHHQHGGIQALVGLPELDVARMRPGHHRVQPGRRANAIDAPGVFHGPVDRSAAWRQNARSRSARRH